MNKPAMALLAAAALSAATLTAIPTAQADLVTYCVGEGGAITVPNDLVVPRNESCVLHGTTVNGNVRVAQGANLIVEQGSLNGPITVAADGYLDTTNTSINGQVRLGRDGFGVYLDTSQLSGNLVALAANEIPGFLYIKTSTVDGSVRAHSVETLIDASEVTGNVTTNQTLLTDVYDSFIDGALTVRETTPDGAVVCGSAIQGATTYTNIAAPVQIGVGPLIACDSGSYFGSDVVVRGTRGDSYVDQAIVNGDLVLTDNNPVTRIGPNMLIRGDIVGDHQEGSAATQPRARSHAQADRGHSVHNKAERRKAAAAAAAAASGKADL